MNIFRSCSSIVSITAVLMTAGVLTLTGCGFDSAQSASSGTAVSLSGMLHGGPNPIVGATVTLYATQSNGYGGTGLQLGQTTTNSNGGFNFSSLTNACPSGQQAYITSAGGNTGSNSTNANSLLMAAVGPCSSLNTGTFIWIDEPSTIAAAYALGNFISITGSGATAVVNISAPANNNALSGSCTVSSGATTTCQAAGLAHAFLNAANLVNASNSNGITTTSPTGTVYSSPPSNSTTSLSSTTQSALLNVVPVQEINTLANAIQACVNSAGTTGASDTTSNCGVLFTNTTVSTNFTSNTVYTTEPTNTLQALINLAKFPFMTSAAVTNIFNLSSASGFYAPTLTASPSDWSIAILWRSYASGANEIGTVYYTTTDINDNVYTSGLTAPATGSTPGTAPSIAQAITSDGVGVWTGPATISATAYCNAFGGTALTDPPCLAATDTQGHLWVAEGVSSSGVLAQVATSSGAVTSFTLPPAGDYPVGLAVDKSNDVFFSTYNTSGTNLWEIPQGSTSSTSPTAVTFGGTAYAGGHALGSLGLDASGNIWGSHDSGSGTGYIYGANSGTFPTETFGTAVTECNNCSSGKISTEGTDGEPSGSVLDASGNYWFTGTKGLYEVPAGGAAASSLAFTLGTASQQMRLASMDGAGTIFVPDSGSGAAVNPSSATLGTTEAAPLLRVFYPAFPTQLTVSIAGCNVGTATGNAACITTNPGAPNNQMFYQAFNAAIDSTGSMWVSSGGNDAIIQIIGTAAPTWPQASYLHPAVMPQ